MPDFQVNENMGGAYHGYPSVAISDEGSFLIIWEDDRLSWDLFGRVFSANGVPKGPEFKINEEGSIYEPGPKTIAAIGRQFVVVWCDNRNWTYYGKDVFAQRISLQGNLLGPNFKVNDEPTVGSYGRPCVTGDNNNVVILWEDRRVGSTYDPNIFMQAFDTLGNPIGNNLRVDDDPVIQQHETPFAAANPDGSWFTVWRDERVGVNATFGQRFNTMNQKIGGNFLISDSTGNLVNPHVAMGLNKSTFVTWYKHTSGELYFRKIDSTNAFTGPSRRVNTPSSLVQYIPLQTTGFATNNFGSGMIAWHGQDRKIYCRGISPEGDLNSEIIEFVDSTSKYTNLDLDYSDDFGVVVWRESMDGYPQVLAKKMNPDGYPVGTKFRVNSDSLNGHHWAPNLTISSDGSYLISWVFEFDILVQKFDAAHHIIWENVLTFGSDRYYQYPVAAFLSDGSFIIAYEEISPGIGGSLVSFRHFDKSGQPLGPETSLSEYSEALIMRSAHITVFPNDDFLIIWHDDRDYDFRYDIYGQYSDKSGNPLSNIIRINDDTRRQDQTYPAVKSNQSGKVIVVWSDKRNIQSEIYGQELNQDQQKIGSNFLISDSSKNENKYYPKVGIDENGGFLVAWSTERDSLKYDIHARYFNKANYPIGDFFVVNEDTVNLGYRECDISMEDDGRAIIVWDDPRVNNWEIVGQRFLADRTRLGSNFKVNVTGDLSRERNPSMVLYDSLIFTAWTSDNSTFGNDNIWANILNYNSPPWPPPPSPPITSFELYQNYPNPFNTGTVIRYQLPQRRRVKVVIYNILGQEVAVIVDNELQQADEYFVQWEPRNLSSGIYMLTLSAGNYYEVRKMVYLK
jgi:hypothetical protein